jgi:hypothetical protein
MRRTARGDPEGVELSCGFVIVSWDDVEGCPPEDEEEFEPPPPLIPPSNDPPSGSGVSKEGVSEPKEVREVREVPLGIKTDDLRRKMGAGREIELPVLLPVDTDDDNISFFPPATLIGKYGCKPISQSAGKTVAVAFLVLLIRAHRRSEYELKNYYSV